MNPLHSISYLLISLIVHQSSSNPHILKPVFPAGTLMKAQMESANNPIFIQPQQSFIQDTSNLYNMDVNNNLQQQQFPISPQHLMMAQQAAPSFVALAQSANQVQRQQKAFMVQLLKNLRLNVLSEFLENVEVPELFEQPALPKTILAPSDEAFEFLPDLLMTKMRRDGRQVARLLRYHVLPGSIPAESIANDMVVNTFNLNSRVRFNVYGKGETTRFTANGALLSRLNVLTGPNVMVHVLDRVLYPFPKGDITTTIFSENCTIYDGIKTALVSSGLEDFFKTSGPKESFTLFLPTTQAFKFVPQKNYNKILEDPQKVSAFVLSHAVNGTYYSQGLRDGQWLTTISRYLVPIWVGVVSDGNSRRLDSITGQVRVLQADIPVDNGVIHLIDRPINPNELVDLFRCESDFV